jgi:hypothetical protein
MSAVAELKNAKTTKPAMTTKPATPLNWREYYDIQTLRLHKAMEERAELVAALRDILKTWDGPRHRAAIEYAAKMATARALLAKLGEDA